MVSLPGVKQNIPPGANSVLKIVILQEHELVYKFMNLRIRTIFFILVLLTLFEHPSFAQATSRALIVGISRYSQLPPDAQLQYADDDAQLFYDFLLSKSAGNFEKDNVRLLLNEKATAAEIYNGLDWLVDETKEGDRTFIYFSGHGDIEKKTMRQRGFLLAHDSPRAGYKVGGTVDITYLQDILETLVSQNKSKVILITDACRSGKLAGGESGVAQTTTALQEQWNNITKILSSQAGELSEESKTWGDGHGVFTYNLINGLWGVADTNGDGYVSLSELNVYLSQEVPKATDDTQHPVVSGNLRTNLSKADPAMVALIASKNSKKDLNQLMASNKGNVGSLDTSTIRLYQHFMKAIENNHLITPLNESAYHYYKMILTKNQKSPALINEIKRTLVARLEDHTQQVLNKYMSQELDINLDGFSRDNTNFIFAGQELDTALALISKNNFRYNSILSRKLFLKANILGCTCSTSDVSHATAKSSLAILKQAILIEPDAAYLYNSIGSSFLYLGIYDSAIANYKKAIELAPTWSYPLVNLATAYNTKGEPEKATVTYNKAIQLAPNDFNAYRMMSHVYLDKKNYEQANHYLSLAYDHASSDSRKLYIAYAASGVFFETKQYDQSLFWFNRLLAILHTNKLLRWPYEIKLTKRTDKNGVHRFDEARPVINLTTDSTQFPFENIYFNGLEWRKDLFTEEPVYNNDYIDRPQNVKSRRGSFKCAYLFKDLAEIYELKGNKGTALFYKACYSWWLDKQKAAKDLLNEAFKKGYKPTGHEPELELLGMEEETYLDLLSKYDLTPSQN